MWWRLIVLLLSFVVIIIIKQPSPRRAAYSIPQGPLPPQLFVFKIATNLSTSASSYLAITNHWGIVLVTF